eukprot:1066951-Rhodomonas_salina.1
MLTCCVWQENGPSKVGCVGSGSVAHGRDSRGWDRAETFVPERHVPRSGGAQLGAWQQRRPVTNDTGPLAVRCPPIQRPSLHPPPLSPPLPLSLYLPLPLPLPPSPSPSRSPHTSPSILPGDVDVYRRPANEVAKRLLGRPGT